MDENQIKNPLSDIGETEENMVESAENVVASDMGVDVPVEPVDTDVPLDKNIRLMSPTRMVLRRFFRSKLSMVGIIMLAALFVFSWFGPVVYRQWGETETDRTGASVFETREVEIDGVKLSLTLSFLTVILISLLGIIMGGIAGYYGGVVDNIIMRICDVLMCLPTLPLMLIIGTVLEANKVPQDYYIYLLMGVLSIFSWPGMARLVRGQILFLREQEYMVAAEAMGYSTKRKIFKHLIPNILPQILVSMTLSLGSMILYESTLSYLNLGVRIPYASWGTMIEIISKRSDILQNNFNVWVPSGICIIIAVLGFNFIGDGLRDALDPKQRR